MPKKSITSPPASLSPLAEQLSELLALQGRSTKPALLDGLHYFFAITVLPAEISSVLAELKKSACVQTQGAYYQLAVAEENHWLLQLYRRQQADPAFKKQLSTRYFADPLAALRRAMLIGNVEGVLSLLAAVSMPVAFALTRDEAGQTLLAGLDIKLQALLLVDALGEEHKFFAACQPVYQYALQHLEDGLKQVPILMDQLGLQALWRGDDQRLAQWFPDQWPIAVGWCRALMAGRYAEALQAFEAFAKQYRSQTRKRKLEWPATLTMLAVLTLIASGDTAHHSTLRTLIEQGQRYDFSPAYRLLAILLDQLEGKECATRVALQQDKAELEGLGGFLLALSRYWLAGEQVNPVWQAQLEGLRSQLGQAGYAALHDEVDALLQAQFGVEPAAGRGRRTPLLVCYQPREPWQYALSALAKLKPAESSASTRLAWFITLAFGQVRLEPKEQKRSAKGQWSKGKPIALRRLHESAGEFDYLLEADRQVLQHIHYQRDAYYYGHGSYELDADAALLSLAGHPALFWSDAPDVRIDLVAGQVALQLKANKGQIELKLTPAKVTTHETLIVEKETPTRLVAYAISDEIRRIAAIVGKGLRVPESAREQLVEAISAIAPLVPVHSDMPELSAHLAQLPADEKLYAHLLPLEAGLRLQLRVRPLPEGGWYPPGRGSATLLGEHQGQPVQAQRALKQELANLQQLLADCPLLQASETDELEWQFTEPQQALEALCQLRALDPAQLECIWPEGERMRIKGSRSLKTMDFKLKQQGDWFVLSAKLELDDGQVLSLRQLLQLMQEGRGRFVKLGEQDWLALDDALRKRLEQLALLADVNTKGDIRLSKLTTPFLAGLAEEAGTFNGDSAWREQLARLDSLGSWQPAVPSTLQAELRDYQREGYLWLSRLAHWGVGACLADDMGLGKTVQTLALLLERAPKGPQLVVAPTSVAMNWLSEVARFAPTLKVQAYHQKRDLSTLGAFDLVVVSYGLLQQDAQDFAAQHWHTLVLDEAQAIKNTQTKRTQAVLTLQADFRMAASGTPIENHLGELWSLFRFLNPGLLGSQQQFNQRYVAPIEQGDALARKTLKTLIQPFMLRRTKSQVLDELPPRTEITHTVSMSPDERHWYEALRQQALENLAQPTTDTQKPLQVLAEITRLRRFCCHPSLVLEQNTLAGSKLAACAEIIQELLENHHKLLIFSQFVDYLAIVRGYLDQQGIDYQYLDGATSPKERKARVDAFQAGQGQIFLISLKAGGTGLNLTAADYVIHLDPWWNPAVEDQASDRAHRMGQQRPVTVYRLVMEHTIEEQIVALHAKKRDLADSLLAGGEVSAKLDADALLALLRGDLSAMG